MNECTTQLYSNSMVSEIQKVPDHTLAQGDYGDYCVANLQYAIDQLYGNPNSNTPLAVDGDFGPHTYNWVLTFQHDHACSQGVDGVAGPNTNSCLASLTSMWNRN
ncbi:hypothetical protein OG762_12030 [Streptomyces sp. NBC_01136]|uniref:peptidoglycan-binding domain-containing protein n=1 Tax=unclassified Streptomyces TaxID=2593676 RepID=UPI003246776D|nr:hypothetical protein OG762_12030 [Streptomyces sp. NBC_01136]